METQLKQRLEELHAEFEAGQRMLAELEQQHANLEPTLLRIAGAIQVLEELLATTSTNGGETVQVSPVHTG
jgi:prefoldin subunit 5